MFTNTGRPYKAMLCRALQTQHPVGQTPAIVIKAGSFVFGLSSHLTSACDRRPLAARGLGIPLNRPARSVGLFLGLELLFG